GCHPFGGDSHQRNWLVTNAQPKDTSYEVPSSPSLLSSVKGGRRVLHEPPRAVQICLLTWDTITLRRHRRRRSPISRSTWMRVAGNTHCQTQSRLAGA